MPVGCASILLEHFAWLGAAVTPGLRLPALESILARGTALHSMTSDADAVRGSLFGLDPGTEVPVGALTRFCDRTSRTPGEYDSAAQDYCLRVDPVTLRADLGRVVMTSSGLAGLEGEERLELEQCVRAVLRLEGLELSADHAERWTISLPHSLPFSFVPLHAALGVNMAEVMPRDLPKDIPGVIPGSMPVLGEARTWRRIHNEIQVALHACEANIRRRRIGQREINAVWIWGGGHLPAPSAPCPFKQVSSNHPVSRGLALLAGCAVSDPESETIVADAVTAESVMIDWSPKPVTAAAELMRLEQLLQALINNAKRNKRVLRFYGGAGLCREYTHRSAWRIWRRLQPVSKVCSQADLT